MKRFLLLLFLVFNLSQSFAQWTIVNTGITQDFNSVNYYSPSTIWIGSYNQIVKTTNGATSWSIINPIKDVSNATIQPANIYDINVTLQ